MTTSKSRKSITPEHLRSVLSYDPISGIFKWTVKPSPSVNVGDIAGKIDSRGYIQIKICKTLHRAHRLAWLYQTSTLPSDPIDHIDGNPLNNRFENLRIGSSGINQQNIKVAQKNGSTGFLGVTKPKDHKNYRASISLKGKAISLGNFATPEQAHEAYLKAKRELHVGCTI